MEGKIEQDVFTLCHMRCTGKFCSKKNLVCNQQAERAKSIFSHVNARQESISAQHYHTQTAINQQINQLTGGTVRCLHRFNIATCSTETELKRQ